MQKVAAMPSTDEVLVDSLENRTVATFLENLESLEKSENFNRSGKLGNFNRGQEIF